MTFSTTSQALAPSSSMFLPCMKSCVHKSVFSSAVPTLSSLTSFASSLVSLVLSAHPASHNLSVPLLPNATALFHFAASVSKMTSAEICFSGVLIHRLVALEIQAQAEQRQCVVSEHNLGTMLVIALILSNKTNTDRPLPIAWWAAAFRVPIATLVKSEAHVLTLLRWHVAPTLSVAEEALFQTFASSFAF
ncbi:hypothetical protein BLNAU_21106 [Blattamonas nauphoetae]|uniref:Uncharacterized protein n=1 Tax=Blattamonas nauphoetae TaxID=2049346 RepID=A0ABQ9X0Y5_9EUKA|nr:hypothetical protein BLNAU_21106 [Blattamonas nauphoetae]